MTILWRKNAPDSDVAFPRLIVLSPRVRPRVWIVNKVLEFFIVTVAYQKISDNS